MVKADLPHDLGKES